GQIKPSQPCPARRKWGQLRPSHRGQIRLPQPLRWALGAGRHDGRDPEANREGMMKRQISYQWRLREVMATHGMFATTDLEPHLHDRDINLFSVQVWRLVTQTPERLSMPVLAALCDIFDCTQPI
ncbi:helix-turn-helix domain-containing protein, partial [Nocardia sp. NPDC004750]